MKVRPIFWRTLLLLIIGILFGAAVIFGFSFSLFLKPFSEWGWQPWVIIGVWVVLSIGLIIATFVLSYYEVYKKYVAVKRGTKTLIYYYSDVVYIDESQYGKKKTIAFFTRQGHARYLIGDKNDILFRTMLANCHNLMSEQDFKFKYPKVKL